MRELEETIMTRNEIVSLIARCLTAFRCRDAGAVAAEHAETCVMESPTAGGPITGRAAIAQVYDAWFKGFPDLAIATEDLVVEEDRFAQLFTLAGTDTGGFLGLPPTGKPFRVPMVWFCHVNEHHIVHSRPIYDFSGVLIQIGILKAKPA
jgi:steroid delta-isomerase-like uncharacterized protein